MGCRVKNVFSGELAVPRKCNTTPAQLASTSFTGGKLSLALFCLRSSHCAIFMSTLKVSEVSFLKHIVP